MTVHAKRDQPLTEPLTEEEMVRRLLELERELLEVRRRRNERHGLWHRVEDLLMAFWYGREPRSSAPSARDDDR